MPTLASTTGSSLVPSVSAFFDPLEKGIEATRKREKEAEAKATLEQRLGTLFGGPGPQVPPERAEGVMSPEMVRISQISPGLGTTLTEVITRNNPQELEGLRKETTAAAKLAKDLSKLPDFAAKQKRLAEEGAATIARGGDPNRIIELQNKSEDELNLEIQKIGVLSNDVLKSIPVPQRQGLFSSPAKRQAFAQLAASSPKLAKVLLDAEKQQAETAEGFTLKPGERRFGPRGAEIARVEEVIEPVKPTTDIGKARADLKAGLITQDDFKILKNTPKKYQSKVGKILGDRQAAIDLYGDDSDQVKAFDAAIKSEQKGEEPKLSDIAGVRKEYTKLSGDFVKLRDAIGKLRGAAANPSAAGDLAMIFSFMKIQDPGSTVREGEFATAQNAASVPERTRAQYNRIITGERLTVNQRKDFLDTANRSFESQEDKQLELEKSFSDLAVSQNMKPEDVVIDFFGTDRPAPKVDVGGIMTKVGTIITNSAGQKGRVEADGNITPLP